MYELMLVAVSENADALLSRVQKALTDASATEVKVDKWGKKILAYKIKKQEEADYFVINFEAEGTNLKSVTDKLRLEQEDLLRYMLMKTKKVKVSKRKVSAAPKEENAGPKVTVVTKNATDVAQAKKVDAKVKSEVKSKSKKKLGSVGTKQTKRKK